MARGGGVASVGEILAEVDAAKIVVVFVVKGKAKFEKGYRKR